MTAIPPCLHRRFQFVGLTVAFFLLSVSVFAELNSVFVVPAYTEGETIVGIEGWEMQYKEPHPVYTDPGAATVVSSVAAPSTQATTLNLKTLVKNRKIGDLGEQFVIEAQFSVTFKSKANTDGGLYFRFGRTEAVAPFHFGFLIGKQGGLYYQGQGERVIVVPKGDMLPSVPYRFLIHVNRASSTFRVTVTCAGDATFHHESAAMPFQERSQGAPAKFGEFCMGNNKPAWVNPHIDYVKVNPLKE